MTTSIKEFDTFIQRLTESGINNPPLIRLTKEWKNPTATSDLKIKSTGELNPEHRLTIDQARQLIESGVNVGIYGSHGGIEIHDVDLEDGVFKIPFNKVQELIVLFDTLTVKTRSGGIDFIFKNSGESKNPHIFYDGKIDAGEVRRDWQYVCVAGSYVPKDKPNPDNGKCKGFTPDATGIYEIVHDAPIRPFDKTKAPTWYAFEKKNEIIKSESNAIPRIIPTLIDKTVIEKATKAANGKKFSRLMTGDTNGYPSESEADAALAAILAYWTRDTNQIARIMRGSGLYREKWDREDYLPGTIASAISLVKEYYSSPIEQPKPEPVGTAPAVNMDNPRLVVNLPNNFIQHYIDYIAGMSDSYAEYQHGAALMLLSLAVNKRAFLPLTIGTIYTNVWVFCLGQSTVSRKTTACTKLTEFIELQNQWMLLSYPGSPEAFVEDLEGEGRVSGPENIGHGILCRDEAGGILSAMEKTYMADMRDLFCQLYDCRPFTRKLRTSQRKAKTTFNIKDTYLTLFFATTPDIFSTYTKLEDLTSGWLLRFLYYYPNYDHKLRNLSTMSPDDRERLNKIGKRIWVISNYFQNHEIEFQFSIAGLSFYNEWKNGHLTQMQRERQEDRGMFDRLSIYALKMAMLYTIGSDAMVDELKPDAPRTKTLDIDDDCLKIACEHVDQYFYPVSKIVFETVGRNEDKNIIEKILGTIRRAGGKISRTTLMTRTHIKKKDLDDGIDTLIESTEIRELTDGGVTIYSL